jgi:Protein of unknown function (DUF3574).
MNCYSLLLGARNTPTAGKRFLKKDDARVRAITARHFPEGFTILSAKGGWQDQERGAFIEEDSRQILITTRNRAKLRAWCQELGAALQQKELLVVEIGPASTFRIKARH